MKTKFKKGNLVVLKDKLTSDPLIVVKITTKKETRITYHGFFSVEPTRKEVDVTRYELSNHKIIEEDELIEYSEGVQRLAKQVEETFKDLGYVLKKYLKSSSNDEDEDN